MISWQSKTDCLPNNEGWDILGIFPISVFFHQNPKMNLFILDFDKLM